jgi:hypothetical protein
MASANKDITTHLSSCMQHSTISEANRGQLGKPVSVSLVGSQEDLHNQVWSVCALFDSELICMHEIATLSLQ